MAVTVSFPARREHMKVRAIELEVNGQQYHLEVPVHRTLLQVLREDLELVGTKYGCGTGECGACTVLLDGKRAINACLTLAATLHKKRITTIDGLDKNGELHPVQKAFIEKGAIQCGFCTPGMIMKTTSLLLKNPKPSDAEIRHDLEGNICRCTGYIKIIDAVKKASELMTAGTD
jgi:aerobic-type carbon monoxide dehydrogenase small subunit (CoxS/CutS family)